MSLSGTLRVCLLAGVVALASTAMAGPPAADDYDLTWLGLAGSQFIKDDGTIYAEATQIADNGMVLGRNRSFYGTSTNFGDAWWVSDGTTTTRVGLFDADHTKSTGYQHAYTQAALSSALGTQAGGLFVFGESQKYRADDSTISNTPWVYDSTTNTTTALGLTGAEYTHADGYTQPSRWEGGDNGNFAGMSVIYNGGTTNMGTASWLYNHSDGTHTRVGLTGAQYVRDDGYVQTKIGRVSPDGNSVFGRTYLYSGSTALGTHGWAYDVATDTTQQIGLTAAANVRDDGYMEVEIRRGNAAGQLNGLSRQYSGATDMGRVAWLFDGTTTTQISPTGAEFVRTDGYRYEDVQYINASGQSAGEATTYDGAATGGKKAWFYDGTTTRVLPGLTGPGFDLPNGHIAALSTGLNDAGQVLGVNTRYDTGGSYIGRQGWLYDSATDVTVALSGLTDAAYTRASDGKQYHYPAGLSQTGMVIGKSDRYDGLFSSGYWVYDWQTDATYELAFSVKSDGYYNTAKRQFTNDGDGVVGYYEVFDEFDVSQGFSLYYWTIDRDTDTATWVDLESRTTLAAMEDLFALYYKGCDMNSDAWFAGTGTMADGSQGAYLLTPASGGLVGDFDNDGDLDADDIDLLFAALGGGDLDFDLTGDSTVDQADVDEWLAIVPIGENVGTVYADFNLDGAVDAGDLALLGASFGQPGPFGWANGDATGDGVVDAGDLALLGGNFGTVVHPVPEPATMSLLALAGVAMLKRRK